jgi:hypothetical protein
MAGLQNARISKTLMRISFGPVSKAGNSPDLIQLRIVLVDTESISAARSTDTKSGCGALNVDITPFHIGYKGMSLCHFASDFSLLASILSLVRRGELEVVAKIGRQRTCITN